MTARPPWRAGPGLLLACLALAVAGAFVAWSLTGHDPGPLNERHPPAFLRTLVSAEEDFRDNDRDGNGVRDYWTADVAGLHALLAPAGPGRVEMMKLIDASMARADGGRPGAVPIAGYLYRAMESDGSGRHPARFGFCAYPAEYGRTGRATFIVSESGTVYRSDTRGNPVLRWPADPAREGWAKAD